MANVYNYVDSTGLITADTADILSEVSAEYQAAFGADLVVPTSLQGASTPQGLLIVTETLARTAVANNNVQLANQINPNIAGGVFLDSILQLTGIQRNPATFSQTTAVLTGVVGTVIPAGSQAQDSIYNNVFATVIENTIPAGGTLTGVVFQALTTGPVLCNDGTLTSIITSVLGWETVGSNTNFILGTSTQSDTGARQLRLNTLAVQGQSTAQAITSGLYAITNPAVTSVGFLENPGAATTVEGVTMVANSIYACVQGGSNGSQSTAIITVSGDPATILLSQSEVSETASGQDFIFTLNPNVPFLLPGTLTATDTTIPMVSTFGVFVEQVVTGLGIPTSTTVSTVTPDTSIVVSNAPTLSGLTDLTFTSTRWVIPDSGSIDLPFTSFNYGIIPAPIGSLTVIVTPVLGWNSATNAAVALLGTQSSIGNALVAKKSAGAAYNNGPGVNISAFLYVPYSNQPMYVLYDNPLPIPIWITISVIVVTPVQNSTQAIQDAILNYAAGGISGIAGLTVGQNVSSFEIAGAVTATYPGIYVKSCLISTSSTVTSPDEISIGVYEIATLAIENIVVIYP